MTAILYKTHSKVSSRPGRPPKRGPVGLSLPASHLTHHSQLKKHRLDNGDYAYENGHLSDVSRMDKSPLLSNGYNAPPTHLNHMPFMQMNHHAGSTHALISPGMPMPPHHHTMTRPDGSIMKNPNIPGMEAIARSGIWENCRAAYEDIVKHLERLRDDRGEDRQIPVDQKPRDLRSQNGSPVGHSPILNLSKSGNDPGSIGEPSDRSEIHSPELSAPEDDDNVSDGNLSDIDRNEKDEVDVSDNEREIPSSPPPPTNTSAIDPHQQAINYSSLAGTGSAMVSNITPSNEDPNLSSTETLLRNIQGLLKVAADNARQQERQLTYEKAELKMELLRERELKDSLDRQLAEERKLRAIYQKRFKKEKRTRRQENIDNELKVSQLQNALKASGAETVTLFTESKNQNEHTDQHTVHIAEHQKSVSPASVARPSSKDITTPSSLQQPPMSENSKTWNYSGIDIMSSGAFWQNYQDSLVQEIELERKVRLQGNENDVKSPLQERPNYYNKNSVLYTSAT